MASRGDVEAGKAHVLIYIKNQVGKGLTTIAGALKSVSTVAQQLAGKFNQLSSIAKIAGASILAPMIAAVASLEEAKQPLEDIKRALAEGIGRPLLPLLITVRDLVLQFAAWAKKNPQVIRQVFMIGVALLGVAAAAKIVASALMLVSGAATLASLSAGALAFLLSPTGLLVLGAVALTAALVGGVAAWLRFSQSGQRAARAIVDSLLMIRPVLDEIYKALINARWEVAGTIIGAAIVKGLADKLVEFKNSLGRFGDMLFGDLAEGVAVAATAALAQARGVAARLPDWPMMPALAGPHPSQTAMTTHEALALGFGALGPKDKSEAALLAKMEEAIRTDGKEQIKILDDILREMKKKGSRVGK